jgi:TolA-binding protein
MKALHLALSLLAIVGAAASVVFYVQIGNTKVELRNERDAAQAQAASLQARLSDTTAQKENLESRVAALESELAESRGRATTLEARSNQLNRELGEVRQQLAAKTDAEANLVREVAQVRRELVAARTAAASGDASGEIAALSRRVAELEEALAIARGIPAAGAGSPKPDTPKLPSPRDFGIDTAQVLSVGPKNAFVVLNLGAAHGMRKDLELAVRRSGYTIARLAVSEVTDQLAVAQVAPDSLRGRLQVGDSADILN